MFKKTLLATLLATAAFSSAAYATHYCIAEIDQRIEGNFVYLGGCGLSDADMPELIATLNVRPQIDTVMAIVNDITDAGAAKFAKLKNLKGLSLSYNYITAKGAKALAKSHLEWLDLGYNELGDEGALALTKSKYLNELVLFRTNLTDTGATNNRLGWARRKFMLTSLKALQI